MQSLMMTELKMCEARKRKGEMLIMITIKIFFLFLIYNKIYCPLEFKTNLSILYILVHYNRWRTC